MDYLDVVIWAERGVILLLGLVLGFVAGLRFAPEPEVRVERRYPPGVVRGQVWRKPVEKVVLMDEHEKEVLGEVKYQRGQRGNVLTYEGRRYRLVRRLGDDFLYRCEGSK